MTRRPLLFCYISLTIKGRDLRGRDARACACVVAIYQVSWRHHLPWHLGWREGLGVAARRLCPVLPYGGRIKIIIIIKRTRFRHYSAFLSVSCASEGEFASSTWAREARARALLGLNDAPLQLCSPLGGRHTHERTHARTHSRREKLYKAHYETFSRYVCFWHVISCRPRAAAAAAVQIVIMRLRWCSLTASP